MFFPTTRKPEGYELTAALALVPGVWRNRVENLYRKKTSNGPESLRTGGAWMLETLARFEALKVPATLTDSEVVALAKEKAAQCLAFAFTIHDKRALRARMAAYVEGFGIVAPPLAINPDTGELRSIHISDDGAIARMTCRKWWAKALRRSQARAIEAEAIRLGYVHRAAEIYASETTVKRRAQQKRRNAAGLEATTARNVDTGQEFTLAELAARSVANPAIRRGELMTRIAGFEFIAKALGHIGVFITVTAPSRYHAKRTAKGKAGKVAVWDNPKYDGSTPRDAQTYLTGMWAQTRAALHRRGIKPYGFRIAEPHHDGAPHWHLLLFIAAETKAAFCRIFAKYARRADAAEMNSKQAKAARFLVKVIDWEKGSAAGYVAKYVSKNIDGYQVQTDIEAGRDAVTGSQRVEAWASTWGIRQFQQIGGPAVGVWRELRRMDQRQESDTVEAARLAAGTDDTKADWGKFVEVMGGPVMKRADRPLLVAKTRAGHRWNYAAGCDMPAPLTSYGEEAAPGVYGVFCAESGRAFPSRRYQWEIKRNGIRKPMGGEICSEAMREFGALGGSAGLCGAVFGGQQQADADSRVLGFEVGRLAGPWSPVNNCTGVESGGVENDARRGVATEIQDRRRAERPANRDLAGAYSANIPGHRRSDGANGRKSGGG